MGEERNHNSRRDFLKSTPVAISSASLSSGVHPLLANGKAADPLQPRKKSERFLTNSERALLGPFEAANGMLLFGITTAIVFAAIQKLMDTTVMNLKD